MEKSFKDQRGKAKVIINGDDAPLKMPEGGITLANRPKKEGGKLPDIGIKSINVYNKYFMLFFILNHHPSKIQLSLYNFFLLLT